MISISSLPEMSGDAPVKLRELPRAEKMYFFERADGFIFHCGEKDAYNASRKYKLIGVSDGTTYVQTLAETPVATKAESQEAIKKAFEAELLVARGHLERVQPSNGTFVGFFPEYLKEAVKGRVKNK